jgi:hypothetical protein
MVGEYLGDFEAEKGGRGQKEGQSGVDGLTQVLEGELKRSRRETRGEEGGQGRPGEGCSKG